MSQSKLSSISMSPANNGANINSENTAGYNSKHPGLWKAGCVAGWLFSHRTRGFHGLRDSHNTQRIQCIKLSPFCRVGGRERETEYFTRLEIISYLGLAEKGGQTFQTVRMYVWKRAYDYHCKRETRR